MRAVYRLLGLARRHGEQAVDAACGKALDVDVISVQKIASMLERATANAPAPPARPPAATTARFARDPVEYATSRPLRPAAQRTARATQLRLVTDAEGEGVKR